MIKHGEAPYLECSSKGDKRFSAFYARLSGLSIEERYQAAKVFEDGTTGLSWREAKGRKAVNQKEVTELYTSLWRRYMDENPELMDVLIAASGLADKFGQEGHACQATVLWELRNEAIEGKLGSHAEYEVAVEVEKGRHQLALKRLERQLKALQRDCPHKKTSFNSDPAGDSSESFHECVQCGKII